MKPFTFKVFLRCFFFASLLFGSQSLKAQSTSGVSSDGRDFYIGYVQPSYYNVLNQSWTGFFKTYALVSTYVDTKVTISYFDDATGVETTSDIYSIPAHTGKQVLFDLTKMTLSSTGEIPQYRACHITSDHPVNVQYSSNGPDGSGSYLALATPALGKRYVIASYNDNATAVDTADGFFLIIAAFSNTTVKITPNATTKGGHPGMHSGAHSTGAETPYSVNLNRGQCYLVKSGSAESDVDISGSIVESNKPIAVLGGQENGSLGSASVTFEPRDYMVEQMIPIDFLDTTGYVSIPLKDSQPSDPTNEGAGENYRVFTFDPLGSNIVYTESGLGIRDMSVGRLAFPPPERFDVTNPVELHSTNGKRFSVMMYDQRNYVNLAPYPAPSMMTIIPLSRWAKSYAFYVPTYTATNDNVNLREYFINVISYTDGIGGGISISFNGGILKPITQVLSLEQQFRNIPNHGELIGARYKIFPGSYYATSNRPFIIYSFGFEGVGGDKDSPPDGDEWYSGNANPAGALLSSGDPGKLRTVIDSECTQWSICAFDDRTNDPGIRSVSLLDDPQGVQSYPGKQSVNCHLDPLFDIKNFGEVELDGGSANVCFNIIIDDPLSAAYAAFMITDNAGNVKVSELSYSPPLFTRTPNTAMINFGGVAVNSDSCISISIKNSESLSHKVVSALLVSNNRFTISSTKPTLPATLKKNDSVIVTICYNPKDTLFSTNRLDVVIDCFSIPVGVTANGITGIITATDLTFSATDTGMSSINTVGVTNIGRNSFTLTKNWELTGSKSFTFVDSVLLPTILKPGQTLPLRIQYTPKIKGGDTALLTWASDIEPPYSQKIKSYSQLFGVAVTPLASVDESQAHKKFSVRPNPVSGMSIFISLDDLDAKISEVNIFDVLGREMYKQNIPLTGSSHEQIIIPIGNLHNGIYYARLIMNGKIVTEKFEVTR